MGATIDRRDFLKRASVAAAALPMLQWGCAGAPRPPAFDRTTDQVGEAALRDFERAFRGTIVRPGDAGYEQARRVFNARFDRRPGLIVRPADTGDVATAVDFARAEGLLTAVRSGGHSYAGHSTCEGGLVVDLLQMKGLEIDPAGAVVRAEPGLITAELDRATHDAGLALVLGECALVGIGGFTLGGGAGALSSLHGMACDNLLSARVVLADGRIVTASADENPDLLWALRGGSGNFGIVTQFEMRAHPVGPVVAGRLIHDPRQAPQVLRALRDLVPSLPDELYVRADLASVPSLPRSPALIVAVLYSGSEGAAEPWLRALRELGKPLVDDIAPKTYYEAQASNLPVPPGLANVIRSGTVLRLEDDMIDGLVALAAGMPEFSAIALRFRYGAPCRVPHDATAYPLRDEDLLFFVTALWQDPARAEAITAWAEEARSAFAPRARGVYVNLLENEGRERVLDAYGDNYARLAVLKAKYDPHNIFHLNQNVVPAS